MGTRGLPLIAALVLVFCCAIGSAAYLLSGGTDTELAIIVLSFAVAIGTGSLLAYVMAESNHASSQTHALRVEVKTHIANVDRRLREDKARSENMALQVDDLDKRSALASSAIADGFNEMRMSYGALTAQLRATLNLPAGNLPAGILPAGNLPEGAQALPIETMAAPQENRDSQPSGETVSALQASDQLLTTLEPVVDLFTTKTAHYRLHLGMVKASGDEVSTDVLLHHADRTGLRPSFDIHAAREALGLLRHLRIRDQALSIFLPIGVASLQEQGTIDRLIAVRNEFADVAGGLVLELPHAMLAGLTDRGLEGLAALARNGVSLALVNVSLAGVDMQTLAKLNVRYISLNAMAVLANGGPSQHFINFAQGARVNRIMTIITQVTDAATVTRLSRVARFASGPAFASPRRVKIGAAQDSAKTAAAAA
jgi:EAL domain-containing protein (putative c-di-GMP-specific phosphodiesterase class I)